MSHKEPLTLKSFYDGSNSKMDPYVTKFEPFELTKFQNSSSWKWFGSSVWRYDNRTHPDWTDV